MGDTDKKDSQRPSAFRLVFAKNILFGYFAQIYRQTYLVVLQSAQNRAEVLRRSIFVYDQEKHIRQEKDESRQEGKEEGREEGRVEGRASMLRDLVIRKVEKGYSLEQIAEAFDYNKDEIEPIYNMVREEAGGYSVQSSDVDKSPETK